MKNLWRNLRSRIGLESQYAKRFHNLTMTLLLALSPLMLANCGSSDGSSSTTTTGYSLTNGICYVSGTSTAVATTYCSGTSTTGYTLTNGVCYVNGTSTVVAAAYCSTTTTAINGTTGYTLTNGVCYASATSTVVAATYCSSTTSTAVIPTVCYGTGYYSPTQGIYGTCYGPQYNNCQGLTLTKNGMTVYCQ